MSDWLQNFKPDKWTLNKKISTTVVVNGEEETILRTEVEELDVELLQMTEMLASLMTRRAMKDEIEIKLSSAFNTLIKEAYPKNAQFFLSKSASNSTGLTYAALKAIEMFNKHASSGSQIQGLRFKALRDYFLMKASSASCTCKASLSLNGLSLIMSQA